MKIKVCSITKNSFLLTNKQLISNGFLFYEDLGIFGFKLNEIEKLIFLGFKKNKEFEGYRYEMGEVKEIFVVGPKFKEEKRSIADRLINIFRTLIEIWKNRKIFKDVDLVFAPFFEYVVFEFLLLKLICKKTRFVVYIIGDYPEWNFGKSRNFLLKHFLILLQKFSQKLSDEVWILSEYLFSKYKTRNSVVVQHSNLRMADLGSFREFNNKTKTKLLFVGRFEKEKQPHIPILIYNFLKKKNCNVSLKLIGDGSLKQSCVDLANDLKSGEIIFKNHIRSRKEIMKEYAESDILIFPSLKGEGLGWVILEAMSQGMAIISTRCGGPEEIIEDGVNGFLIDIDGELEGDIIAKMANKIKSLVENPELFEEISKNNIEKAKNYTVEKFIDVEKNRILNLLNK